MKNIAFIINPVSGSKETQNAKKKLPKIIMQTLDMNRWLPNIMFTEYAGHATELAYQFARMGFDAVVAVGGDGNKAIEMLNHSEPISVDYGLANNRLFVSTCGTGFDAVVADNFAGSNKRGFMTYLQNTIKQAFSYHPETYHIVGDGIDVTHKAFLVTFANANQWGYEALIAPKASVQDGKMDIMLMSSHAILGSAALALRLFAGSIDNSYFMDTIRAREITLEREMVAPFHIDGDPVEMEKDIHIRIIEDGLKVLVEKRF